MNQGKRRIKEVSNQPNIKDFITPSRADPLEHRSRSSSVKRKKDSPPCLLLDNTGKK